LQHAQILSHVMNVSPRRRDCLPASSSHPLLLSAEGAAGASRRRELRARAPPPPPHIEKKGRRRPWAAAAHPAVGRAVAHLAVGARTTARGDPAGARRCRWRSSVCWRRRKKGRETNGGWLTLSSVVENEASDFFLLPPDVRVQALPFYDFSVIYYDFSKLL
jgi:hypothetical protein